MSYAALPTISEYSGREHFSIHPDAAESRLLDPANIRPAVMITLGKWASAAGVNAAFKRTVNSISLSHDATERLTTEDGDVAPASNPLGLTCKPEIISGKYFDSIIRLCEAGEHEVTVLGPYNKGGEFGKRNWWCPVLPDRRYYQLVVANFVELPEYRPAPIDEVRAGQFSMQFAETFARELARRPR